jgi:hypothetical protein
MQIRETKQEDKAYNSRCASRRPTANTRKTIILCSEWHGATSTAEILLYAGQERVPEAGPSGSEAEITLARILSRCQMRIYCTRENIAYSMETSPQVRAHVINRLLSTVRYRSCKYGMPVSRNVVFFPAHAVGMWYGRKSSEFGVPRGGTAWRARGPPMAGTEAETQPHSCSPLWGHLFEPSAQIILLIAGLSHPLLASGTVLCILIRKSSFAPVSLYIFVPSKQ